MVKYTVTKLIQAICHMDHPKEHGYVIFSEDVVIGQTKVELHLNGLPPGLHGFHIHQTGDRRNGCDSLGSHFNPYGGEHADVNQSGNHLGDLGNITVDNNGKCEQVIVVNHLLLTGKHSVIGRGLIVHADIDDLGKGGHDDSKTTGHSGKRIACGVIGILSGL